MVVVAEDAFPVNFFIAAYSSLCLGIIGKMTET